MTEEKNENVDSKNDADEVETSEEEQTTDNESKEDELSDREKQFLARAKKAEAKVKEFKEKPETKQEPKVKTETKSNEPDYARIAFLEQRKITEKEDQKMVQEEAERLKLPLTDILGMEHIKAKLKNANDQREAEDGMPKTRGKSSSGNKDEVAYHLKKGTTPDDLETAKKVIDARVKKEENSNQFSDILHN